MTRQHSIVPHKANYYYRVLEDDYLLMYQTLANELDPRKIAEGKKASAASDCKAMIASILEGWMNWKRGTAKCEEDMYIYLTYDEWEVELRGHYKRSTIIQCLKEMEEEGQFIDTEGRYGERGCIYTGTIKKRHFVQNTFQYLLNLPVVVPLLEKLPEQSPFERGERPTLGRPSLNRPKINDIKINGLKTDDSRPKINDGSVKINAPFYTKNNKENTKKEEDRSVDAQASDADVSSFSLPDEMEHSVPSMPLPIATENPQPTGMEEVTKEGLFGDVSQSEVEVPITPVSYKTFDEWDKQFKTFVAALKIAWNTLPPKSRLRWTDYSKVPIAQWQKLNPKPELKAVPLTAEQQAFQARCRELQAKINDWRGYALETQGPIINERKCIRTLCEKYTDNQIQRIYTYLFEQDWKWSKPDNRYRIGANEILTEAGRVIQQLKEQQSGTKRPAPTQNTSSSPRREIVPQRLPSREEIKREIV